MKTLEGEINNLFKRFRGVELVHIYPEDEDKDHFRLAFKMPGTGRLIYYDPFKEICFELEEFLDKYSTEVTTTSIWVEGVLQGKTRDANGVLR